MTMHQIKYRMLLIGFIAIFPIILFAVMAQFAFAVDETAVNATITVDTTNDELNDNGNCSLREAIESANTDTAVDQCTAGNGWDTINIPAGTYTLTLAGVDEDGNATGDLDVITDSVTIIGAGASNTTIDGGAIDRVLDVDPLAQVVTVELQDVTLTNGSAIQGGGLRQLNGYSSIYNSIIASNVVTTGGGGIYAQAGVMRLISSTVQNNASSATSLPGGGGGLRNEEATVYLQNSTVYSNSSGRYGGGVYNEAGSLHLDNSQVLSNTAVSVNAQGVGIYARYGNVFVQNQSQIAYNQNASSGGGIYANSGQLLIQESELFANSANSGGAVYASDFNVRVENSSFAENEANNNGGAIYGSYGGSIQSSTFEHNEANYGGALYGSTGSFTVQDSTFYSNTAVTSGGVFDSSDTSITIVRSVLRENYAGNNGGALHLDDDYPFYYISDSLIVDNTAVNDGGGIRIGDECGLHVERTTFTGNKATQGGGIHITDECGLFMVNSTVSANEADYGGGIFIEDDTASATIEYSTITNNEAATAGGGVYLEDDPTPTLALATRNTIIAGNQVNGTLNDAGADCAGSISHFISGGGNLFGDGTGCSVERYDQTVIPANVATTVLLPLADNGGTALPGGLTAPTHALRDNSAAIDAGTDLLCPAQDQIGTIRVQGNACDVGATESGFNATVPTLTHNEITVSTFSDDLTDNGNCTLREAVQAANTDSIVDTCAAGDGWDTIVLSAGTYALTLPSTNENSNLNGDLDVITGSITFQGAGERLTFIDGNEDDRVLHQLDTLATAIIWQDVTVQNGRVSSEGGCVAADAGLMIFNRGRLHSCETLSNNDGGGIYSELTSLYFVDSTVEDNQSIGSSADGGGIFIEQAYLALYDSVVQNNRAGDDGGGIYVEHVGLLLDASDLLSNTAGISITTGTVDGAGYFGYEGGLVMRNDSKIQYNEVSSGTSGEGGGINAYSGVIIENSTISHNKHAHFGGGVYTDEAGGWIVNSVIEQNEAGQRGGGVYFDSGGEIYNSYIRDNEASQLGGGIYNGSGSLVFASEIYSNTAVSGGGIYNTNAALGLFNSDVRWNEATGNGGGVNGSTAGTILAQSMIRDNVSGADGGGVYVGAAGIDLIDTTIANNSSANDGGGLYVASSAALVNSTVSGNDANQGAGAYLSGTVSVTPTLYLLFSTVADNTAVANGGGVANVSGTAVVEGSIIAGNSANGSSSDAVADCEAIQPFTFAGHSIFGDGTGCLATGPNDQTIAPATVFTTLLNPLADNGGSNVAGNDALFTHALIPGSSAIDAIPSNTLGCGSTIDSDQRGKIRPFDSNFDGTAACDIGAVEVGETIHLPVIFK